ncbi:MAG: hypothetical protein JNL60_01245 [Bacteroidia bacterium]|nr:hypothetical protein [Bacteroidia bacterium]
MNFEVKYPLVVAAVYLWIGFVCAISFMEAWLKFRAPGVDMPIGLGIGRLVFNALNKIEWIFVIVISMNLLLGRENIFAHPHLFFILPLLLHFVQTFWLLPALDARAELRINGQNVPPSYLHIYFIIAEVVKVSCLFIYSIRLFK